MPSAKHHLSNMNMLPERMRLLLSGAITISNSLQPREVARVSIQLATQMLSLPMGLVVIFDNEFSPIILSMHGISAEQRDVFLSPSIADDSSPFRRATESQRIEVVANTANGSTPFLSGLHQMGIQSLACFPFAVPENISGVLMIADHKPMEMTEEDRAFLNAIAHQISTGMRNAWIFSKSQRQIEEVRSVAEAAQVVVSSLDLNHILNHIMGEVTSRLQTEAAALLLLDSVREELEFSAVAGPSSDGLVGVRLPMGQGIVGWVAQHNEPLLVPDVAQDPRFFKGLDEGTETHTQSVLCVPLCAREQLIGVVEVINKKRGRFTRTDQQLLESLALFAAVAIENARLFDEANRQIEQATLYAKDLSQAYKRERQQRTALDKLRYSFLNVVSHELKTPLTVILQGLEALQNPKRGTLNPEQHQIVDMLEEQSGHLEQLIDGLVAFATFSARQGTMRFAPTPFGEVLDDAMALAQFKAASGNIVLEDIRPAELPVVLLDKDRISEAIVHLIDNAVKFSPEDSVVTIRTEIDGAMLKISIEDQGQGIPPEKIDSIWDSFSQMNETLERGLEGLGLGLAIARYIVEAHNGKISVQSVVGQGSIFTIQQPLSPVDDRV